MIKKTLCKLGFHKYDMRQFRLTSGIATIVRCKWCGTHLSDEMEKECKKKREKTLEKMAKVSKKFQK